MNLVEKFSENSGEELGIWHEEIELTLSSVTLTAPKVYNGLKDIRLSNHSTCKILLQIRATGEYVQQTPKRRGNLVEGVLTLTNIENATIFMEEYIAKYHSRADILYISRLYVERSSHRLYLTYDPNDGNGSVVTLKRFSSSGLNKKIDGTCFLRKDFGNDTIFGSIFQKDMFMTFDKGKQGLVMRIVPRRSLRNGQYFFSIERQSAIEKIQHSHRIRPTFETKGKSCAGNRIRHRYKKTRLPRKHRRKRLQWAIHHMLFTNQQWGQVLFCSDCKFNFVNADRQCSCRGRCETCECYCVKRKNSCEGGSVHVWGGIGRFQKAPLVILSRSLTASSYVNDILQPVTIPFIQCSFLNNAIIQHNNATPHTARLTTNFLQENGVQVLKWPAMSPDLSPMKQLWGELGRRVYSRTNPPQTVLELREALTQEWQIIPQSFIESLVLSMPSRCVACVDENGTQCPF